MSNVLIVEDEPSIAELYRLKLELGGFDVRVASNGASGLVACKQQVPDLILLDLRMPSMSGDEMLAQLRSTPWGATPRVIVLTNISRDEAPSSLRFLNVDRYIVKAHHTPQQVLEIVREVLGIRHA